jgi:hypothetical protein
MEKKIKPKKSTPKKFIQYHSLMEFAIFGKDNEEIDVKTLRAYKVKKPSKGEK